MTARLPLPTRLQLQTLTGLRQAVVGGANAVSNDVVTLTTVDGFINAAEDDFLQPLRLIWMRNTDTGINLDQYGWFDIRTALSQTCLELVSVYSRGGITGINNSNYWQYEVPYDRKDLSTFRKLQGNVNVEPIYTVDGSIVKVWPPANYYGPICCSYYADWPRLGDVSTQSSLQQVNLNIVGGATVSGSLNIASGTGATSAGTTIAITSGMQALDVINLLLKTPIGYATDEGGNVTYWTVTQKDASNVLLTAPTYVASNRALVVTNTATGIVTTVSVSQNAKLTIVTNNWFMDNYPYMYYYGALKHVFLYLNDLERAKWAHDEAMKLVSEMQAVSDRADVSDISDGFNWNQSVQW